MAAVVMQAGHCMQSCILRLLTSPIRVPHWWHTEAFCTKLVIVCKVTKRSRGLRQLTMAATKPSCSRLLGRILPQRFSVKWPGGLPQSILMRFCWTAHNV